jgi:Zn-dependent M28 family amino/carboxypeptidase
MLTRKYILFSAHHDHLGIGDPDKSGDTIYNGAIDNASGLAMLLASLQFFANLETPTERSVAFVSFTAEEAGLLGSLSFMTNLQPTQKPVCNINFDIGNLFGKTKDIVALGYDKGDIGNLFETAARKEGLTPAKDPQPDKGSLYLSYGLISITGQVLDQIVYPS